MIMPPTGKKIVVNMPLGMVSETGVSEILHLLCVHVDPYVVRHLFPPTESIDWEWRWQVGGKAELVGNLPKRISKRLYQYNRIKLDEAVMTEIGNIAAQNVEKKQKFVLDFTQKFDWRPGDFADGTSCFLSGEHTALPYMRSVGAYAARFWSPYDVNCGVGRVWMLPYPPPSADPFGWIVLNGYFDSDRYKSESPSGQKYGQLQTSDLTRVIAHVLGLTYKAVQFSDAYGHIYANSGGASFFVSDAERQAAFQAGERIRYSPEKSVVQKYIAACCYCGEQQVSWDAEPLDLGDMMKDADGLWHPKCWDRVHVECCQCHAVIHTQRTRHLAGHMGGNYKLVKYLCMACVQAGNWRSCPRCASLFPATRELYCPACTEAARVKKLYIVTEATTSTYESETINAR